MVCKLSANLLAAYPMKGLLDLSHCRLREEGRRAYGGQGSCLVVSGDALEAIKCHMPQ